MNPVATAEPRATTVSTATGPLSSEAGSLRHRLNEIRALTDEMPTLSDAQVLEAMRHVRFLVDHIAAHGHAEEHVVYPYIETFMSGSSAEVAGLRGDHVRLDDLGRAIIEWTPEQNRTTLHDLLSEFLEIVTAHLLVEGEYCMPVVHAHILTGTEQVLFEAVEICMTQHLRLCRRPLPGEQNRRWGYATPVESRVQGPQGSGRLKV
jgi:hemerythrin superfamily protein